jgi:methionyl-tRNA synthetase
MPETSDSDFSWQELLRRNNDELVATWGNLVHRVLTFTYRNFGGAVPTPGELDGPSQALMARARSTLDDVGASLGECRFREAIWAAMSLAQEANRYLEETSPWKAIRQDRQAAGSALYVALAVISSLKTVLYPFLPFSSQKLHNLLGFDGSLEESGWTWLVPPPGQKLESPEPLFVKLDEKIVAEEMARQGLS